MIECKNISFSYGTKTIFSCFNFTLTSGITTILGPNGCGKTTLLKLLSGFEKPDSGEILLNGVPLSEFSGRKRAENIAVVPQFMPPSLDFTVEEFIRMGKQLREGVFNSAPGNSGTEEKILQQLELEPFRKTPCNRLSGGERQRVAAAQAILQETPILLLDEPTASMDPAHAVKLFEILKNLPSTPWILTISHDIILSQKFSDRIVLMTEGSVIADGTPAEILSAAALEKIYQCPAKYFSLT